MKLKCTPKQKFLILAFLLFSESYPNCIIAGGYVAEIRNFSITPVYNNSTQNPYGAIASIESKKPIEIATIQIDNNLPNYQLVLDFADKTSGKDNISEVQIHRIEGTLGHGLILDGASKLNQQAETGRFIWSPGTQQTATLNFQIRVLITYKNLPASVPVLTVSMPSSY